MTREEALQNIKKVIGFSDTLDESIFTLFPELKESEDEKIRKFLVELVSNDKENNYRGLYEDWKIDFDNVLAWLEKQKEQKDFQTKVEQRMEYLWDKLPDAHRVEEGNCTPEEWKTLGSYMELEMNFDKDSEEQKEQEKCPEYCVRSHCIGCSIYEKRKEQKSVEKENTLTDFEKVLNIFLFDFANSPIEDCEPKEYIKKHSAEILKAAYKELNAKLQQDIFEAKQEGRQEGYEVAKAEQKPAEFDEYKIIKKHITEDMLSSDVNKRLTECGWYVTDKKPEEWSEKDEKIRKSIIWVLEVTYPSYREEIDWLKSLRPQPKNEWSEEDKFKLEDAITGIDVGIGFYETEGKHPNLLKAIIEAKEWLKSLHPQPHTVSIKDTTKFGNLEYERGVKDGIQHAKNYQWKPSEEQMKALKIARSFVVDDFSENPTLSEILKALYEQLKKLMEE